jgi:hypothetical protein
LYIITHDRNKTSKPYASFAVEFDNPEEAKCFWRKSSSFAPESSHIKFNIYKSIIEIVMPESLIHSNVAHFVTMKIIDALRSQLYIAGLEYEDLRLRDVGTGCTSFPLLIPM